jgi:hypothetical protein
MSAVLILTPLVIGSWPAISAAAAGAAVALGLTVKKTVQEEVKADRKQAQEMATNRVEIEMTNSDVLQNVATDQEIVLTKGTIEIRVKRDARGRCTVCATGAGHTKAELKKIAEDFTERMTQCFVYNRVMTELKSKGFQVVNEERMQDETVRINVRRWEA